MVTLRVFRLWSADPSSFATAAGWPERAPGAGASRGGALPYGKAGDRGE